MYYLKDSLLFKFEGVTIITTTVKNKQQEQE